MNPQKLFAFALAFCMLFVLCSCGGTVDIKTSDQGEMSQVDSNSTGTQESYSSGDAERIAKDELVVGTTNEVTVPFDNFNNNNLMGVGLCYDFLTYTDNVTGETKSDILEDWYYEDDTTIVMKVRSGITFSSGDPLTAHDIVFSFAERLNSGMSQTDDYANFDWDSAEISDDGLTLTLKTFEPYAPGIMVLRKSIESEKQHEQYPLDSDYWWNNTCGSGPYYLVEQVDGVYAAYALRDDYWGEEEYMFKTVTVKYYSEETALYIDYQNGNVDIAMNLGAYSYEQLKSGAVKNTVVRLQSCGNYAVLYANPYKFEAWNDVRVRLAVAHAIDWDSLVNAAYDGLAIPLNSIFPTNCLGYESLGNYEYDPDLSRQLLEEAGYGDGFQCELLVRSNFSTLAEVLQGMLAEVGIELSPKIVEFGVYLPELMASNFDFILNTVNTDNSGEPSKVYSSWNANAVVEASKITDPVWNDMLARSYTVDEEARIAALHEIQEYAHENCLFIPMAETCEVWCFNNSVLPSDFNCYYGGWTIFAVPVT